MADLLASPRGLHLFGGNNGLANSGAGDRPTGSLGFLPDVSHRNPYRPRDGTFSLSSIFEERRGTFGTAKILYRQQTLKVDLGSVPALAEVDGLRAIQLTRNCEMRITSRDRKCNSDMLPLFVWAERRERELLPPAVRRLAVRLNVSPSHARTLAELAGYKTECAR